jgi:hypothetical protein
MVILGALPVQHLLLISPYLSGAFRVYLPAAGLAIAWSVLLDGIPRWPSATLVCLLLLAHDRLSFSVLLEVLAGGKHLYILEQGPGQSWKWRIPRRLLTRD